jgi:hypothetical protein
LEKIFLAGKSRKSTTRKSEYNRQVEGTASQLDHTRWDENRKMRSEKKSRKVKEGLMR